MVDRDEEYFYAIFRLSETEFQVAKFKEADGCEAPPRGLYKVKWDAKTGRGRCDCPAAVYRQTGVNDKHVQMVKEWVANGDSFRKRDKEI